MIGRFINWLIGDTKPAMLDGALYAAIALFMFMQTHIGSDDAAKFITPFWLFIIKGVIGAIAATLLAIKLFRSSTYAEYQQQKKADDTGETQVVATQPAVKSGNTEFLARKPEPKKD